MTESQVVDHLRLSMRFERRRRDRHANVMVAAIWLACVAASAWVLVR